MLRTQDLTLRARGLRPLVEGRLEDALSDVEITDDAPAVVEESEFNLPERWTPLRYHAEQQRFVHLETRIIVAACGRRSGKTEIGKRKGIVKALEFDAAGDGKFVFAAPTHQQAKQIFWDDLKALVPHWAVNGEPYESNLTMRLYNGAIIQVAGLDKPQRVEGSPIDWLLVTEFDDVKPETWERHLYPALDTPGRQGQAILEGVPEGRRELWRLRNRALEDDTESWAYVHWKSSEILTAEQIREALRNLDPLTYRQEYDADFVVFQGLAYYTWSDENLRSLEYDPKRDLVFCFDFNVEPGTAVVCQEQDAGTACIGEVYIERGSNTPKVCDRLIEGWGHHEGTVRVYGDATGGNRGSAKVEGTDWDLVKNALRKHFKRAIFDVQSQNPPPRVRINAMNTRICRGDGVRNLFVDPGKCPHLIEDFEGVQSGNDGDVDKKSDKRLTHLTDGLGYYVWKRFPIAGRRTKSREV